MGNTAEQCRLGLFQDSDFGDLEDSKSTSGGTLCKKQTSVSHSSTKAEIISLDAGLRMDGIPALTLWDSVIEVFHSSPNQTNKTFRSTALRMRGEVQLTYKTFLLDVEASDTNDNENQDPEKHQHEAQHEHVNVCVVVKVFVVLVLCCRTHLAHIAWLKMSECSSHPHSHP